MRVVDLGHQQAHPTRRLVTEALGELAFLALAAAQLDGLREIALVWDLHNVLPLALVIAGEGGRNQLLLGRARRGRRLRDLLGLGGQRAGRQLFRRLQGGQRGGRESLAPVERVPAPGEGTGGAEHGREQIRARQPIDQIGRGEAGDQQVGHALEPSRQEAACLSGQAAVSGTGEGASAAIDLAAGNQSRPRRVSALQTWLEQVEQGVEQVQNACHRRQGRRDGRAGHRLCHCLAIGRRRRRGRLERDALVLDGVGLIGRVFLRGTSAAAAAQS